MPPTDANAGSNPAPVHAGAPVDPGPTGPRADDAGSRDAPFNGFTVEGDEEDGEETLDLHLPADFLARFVGGTAYLLDQLSTWGPVATPAGSFHLVPVHLEQDVPLVHRWMNDPAVARFWELAGPQSRTEDHLRAQLEGDGRSVPCLGVLEGTPMSYWEIYRADLDPLARHYPARPHDTGIHLLVGGAADRGRGLGSILLRAVADLVLDRRPACARVVAEPDLHNTPSVAAFLSAGFRFAAEVDLPGKRAALMIRDRVLRDVL
ncbi:GNAT family N-acetyltransferase [Streptomyces broussonetiae]|uniref:Lysine N-acyltransferase MbtK n=1 Tax=Streptomyces broussonetiae TaxID=2686304 RepID=A0A6I6N6Z4_9ACTN|nr:GNAT family N-acetyltransferase [Streptomyces broussonetiae]QHA07264.1 GNAT family N-acetyltransferase [Streptomyces broussonetiae]